jgi:hypothetical protein
VRKTARYAGRDCAPLHFVNLKGCPICTNRRCWFDGREWKCPGCFPRELEGRIWLESNSEPTQ